MRRVAYLLATFPTVTETFVVGEILELRRRGLAIELFALREHPTPVEQPEAEALRGETTYLPGLLDRRVVTANVRWVAGHPRRYFGTLGRLLRASWRNPVHLAKTVFLFLKAVELGERLFRRDIRHLHAHWATYPTTVALAVSELTDIPFSFTAHAWDVSMIRTLLPQKLARARFVITCTEGNRRDLVRLLAHGAQGKVHLNYHGIDLERFRPVSAANPDGAVILACGALFERKGFADLVRACGILARRKTRFECVIVGDGPQRPELEALIAGEGLTDRVRLLGALPQQMVVRQYARSHVFVLPCLARRVSAGDHEADVLKALEAWFEGADSRIQDGIPNVLVEAMAMGIPVISTPVGGIPELVQDGVTGLLAPAQDPLALADAIARILEEPALRARLSAQASAFARSAFDRDENTARLAEIFASHLEPTWSPSGAAVTAGSRS